MDKLVYFNNFVHLFWIIFGVFQFGFLALCCWWDGVKEFIKTDLGDSITIIVCFAFFAEMIIVLTRMSLL